MKRIKTTGIVISILVVIFYSVINSITLSGVVENNHWMDQKTQICAHRGGALLNPENTKKAFDHVIFDTDYVDIVEIDIRLTKDNVIVINHDSNINRMALENNEASIEIENHTYSELKNYNLGKNFVSLDNTKPYFDYSIDRAR